DPRYNLHTHDFAFTDAANSPDQLPGTYVGNPPAPWQGAAVSAHANAARVASFLRDVLRRDGVDGGGGRLLSRVNCCYLPPGPGEQEWRNAAWHQNQMIYGQRRLADGSMRSYAVELDVVAHEIFHGVTQYTAALQYQGETGALNESYSDVFGILVANRGN